MDLSSSFLLKLTSRNVTLSITFFIFLFVHHSFDSHTNSNDNVVVCVLTCRLYIDWHVAHLKKKRFSFDLNYYLYTYCFKEETILSVFVVTVWTVDVSVTQNVIVYAPEPSFFVRRGTSESFKSIFGGWAFCNRE